MVRLLTMLPGKWMRGKSRACWIRRWRRREALIQHTAKTVNHRVHGGALTAHPQDRDRVRRSTSSSALSQEAFGKNSAAECLTRYIRGCRRRAKWLTRARLRRKLLYRRAESENSSEPRCAGPWAEKQSCSSSYRTRASPW